MILSIRNWQKHFEKSDLKKCRSTKWIPLPNRWDGKGFRRIMRLKDGESIFCAWVLMVQIASRCPKRGVLVDDDGPLTPADLSDKTGCKEKTFERAIEVLSSKEIAWISIDYSTENAGNFRDSPEKIGLQDRTGQDSNLPSEDSSEPLSASDSEQPSEDGTAIMVFPCVGRGPTEWRLTDAKVEEYRQSFPAVDVLGECRKARQWCIDNASKRKTARGLPAFLSRWLTRVQDSGASGNGPRIQQRTTAKPLTAEQMKNFKYNPIDGGVLE